MATIVFTSRSWETTLARTAFEMPMFDSTWRVYAPIGTVGVPTTSLRPGLRRSKTLLIPAGLPFGTMITSLFVANVTGFVTMPALYSACGASGLAAAKTSAGAPSRIWAARVSEPAKLYFWLLSRYGKTSVSDAAAKTVSGSAFGAFWVAPEAVAVAVTPAAATSARASRALRYGRSARRIVWFPRMSISAGTWPARLTPSRRRSASAVTARGRSRPGR